ncbi:MAG: MBOAT family O-acyltransferase [Bacteroidia bacterium]|nr:MBOAT family O-acyltransferase [Bacteroidia bacterium]
MLFNSFIFAVYLPIVFVLYWFVFNKHLRAQNALIVFVSYFFYGWWDPRFLALIFMSTLFDYLMGIAIHDAPEEKRKKMFMAVSFIVNLTFLGFFKYYNFFAQSLIDAFAGLGVELQLSTLNIVLPVGISFYTFQSLSYTIDVYRGDLKPTRDPVNFYAFVSFFPQLVAGPIERATNLLPQFYEPRHFDFDKAKDGMKQIFWGLFKKIVVADTCADVVNTIFGTYEQHSGSTLFIAAVLFSFQIYCDFSGYSDIAIGCARLFGFELMQNFNKPYLSRDIGEFWRRWHMSLSTWFRDYIYFPLGGSRVSKWLQFRNNMIVFTVSGFWHGANWTFLFWGFLNGLYYLPIMLRKNKRPATSVIADGKLFPSIQEVLAVAVTFFFTVIAWVFFRAKDIQSAFTIVGRILSPDLFTNPATSLDGFNLRDQIIYAFLGIGLLMTIEWFTRTKKHGLEFKTGPTLLRWTAYTAVIVIVFLFRRTGGNLDFIYFQF